MNHGKDQERERERKRKDEMPKRGSRAAYEEQWDSSNGQKRERLIQSIGTKASHAMGGPDPLSKERHCSLPVPVHSAYDL